MEAILEPLVNSPRLFDYLADLNEMVRQERERRERFYAEITPEHKWEFINGEVVMHSPAKVKHLRSRDLIARLINTHVDTRHLGWAGGEKALVCFPRNDYEPDILYYLPPKAESLEPDQWKLPVPDFAVEVLSSTTEKNDRGVKFVDYAAHGVGEYWIVDPDEETIEQYLLPEGANAYQLAAKQADGTIHSRVISGFIMPVRAAFDSDENLRALWAMKP
jgi:Uma2 family endonuclease